MGGNNFLQLLPAGGWGFLGCGQDSGAAPVLPCALLPSGRKKHLGRVRKTMVAW